MSYFAYQGQCPAGTSVAGTIEATDVAHAIEQLESMRVRVIEVEAAERPKPKRAIGYDDFIFFNDQLASLAEAGLALDRGLREIAKDMRSRRLKGVIHKVADDLQRGTPLEDAIAAHEGRLPILYSRVIRAGVRTNQLSATLLNLSQHLRFLSESRWIVFEALAYPAVVLFAALAIFSVIVLIVLSQFEDLFFDFGVQLPALTQAMFSFAHVYPWLLLGAGTTLAALVLSWGLLRATPAGRCVRERILYRVPVIGTLLRCSLHARFFRSAAVSIRSGLGLPEALRLAAGATGSVWLDREAQQAADRLETGESVSRACQGSSLIPVMFGYVADVAASRGDLPDAMAHLARAYEQRAAHRQGILRSWLMPLAVVLVAFAVGLCILGMFLPLVSLISSVSGGS